MYSGRLDGLLKKKDKWVIVEFKGLIGKKDLGYKTNIDFMSPV